MTLDLNLGTCLCVGQWICVGYNEQRTLGHCKFDVSWKIHFVIAKYAMAKEQVWGKVCHVGSEPCQHLTKLHMLLQNCYWLVDAYLFAFFEPSVVFRGFLEREKDDLFSL